MSCWTTTVPNSVRNSAPVGQASRQPACVQCLQTSDDISQRICLSAPLCPVCGSNSLSASALSTLCCAFARLTSSPATAGDGPALLDERHVPPAVRAELAGVVVGHAGQADDVAHAVRVVHRQHVPLLA